MGAVLTGEHLQGGLRFKRNTDAREVKWLVTGILKAVLIPIPVRPIPVITVFRTALVPFWGETNSEL